MVGELILPPAPLQAKAMGVRHCNRGILLVEHPLRSRHFQPVQGFLVGSIVVGFPGLLGDRQGLPLFNHLSKIKKVSMSSNGVEKVPIPVQLVAFAHALTFVNGKL